MGRGKSAMLHNIAPAMGGIGGSESQRGACASSRTLCVPWHPKSGSNRQVQGELPWMWWYDSLVTQRPPAADQVKPCLQQQESVPHWKVLLSQPGCNHLGHAIRTPVLPLLALCQGVCPGREKAQVRPWTSDLAAKSAAISAPSLNSTLPRKPYCRLVVTLTAGCSNGGSSWCCSESTVPPTPKCLMAFLQHPVPMVQVYCWCWAE